MIGSHSVRFTLSTSWLWWNISSNKRLPTTLQALSICIARYRSDSSKASSASTNTNNSMHESFLTRFLLFWKKHERSKLPVRGDSTPEHSFFRYAYSFRQRDSLIPHDLLMVYHVCPLLSLLVLWLLSTSFMRIVALQHYSDLELVPN